MKKIIICIFYFLAISLKGQEKKISLFNNIVFYDGYKPDSVANTTPPANVIRFDNTTYSKKLIDEQIDSLSSKTILKVIIKAACDNYDRIGGVKLAFVEKNQDSYNFKEVKKLELARFITPFMNKNKKPDTVPYIYDVSNLNYILKDLKLRDSFDFWIEFNVFGTTGAGQTQITGCKNKFETFYGFMDFYTSGNDIDEEKEIFVHPILTDFQLKKYNINNTDKVGTTVKTVKFNTIDSLIDAKLYIITSNHGANQGGEEYIRRIHNIYFDNKKVLTYTPGEPTCEPYRIYNTQGNGIYSASPRPDSVWQSFSNWCPGALIPIRSVNIGKIKKGEHTFKIDVPDAEFVGDEGYFPVSVYIQGKKIVIDTTPNNIKLKDYNQSFVSILDYNQNSLNIKFKDNTSKNINIFNSLGQLVLYSKCSDTNLSFNIEGITSGVYTISVKYLNSNETKKIVINR